MQSLLVRRVASSAASSCRRNNLTVQNEWFVRASRRTVLQQERQKSSTANKRSASTTTTTTATANAAASESVSAASEEASLSTGRLVGTSLAAAMAGVCTVSAFATVVEMTTASTVPEYSSTGQRFSQEEFSGRFFRMLLACDPRLLLYTESEVRQAQKLLQGDHTGVSDRTLWESRRIVDAAVHPDTDEVIPRPFRMSGYVPYNGPICVAMVASTSTLPLLAWSWVNQSQNALVNYYNRNASSPMSNETLLKSYSAAVGSALAVAFGLATLLQKRYPPAQAKALMRWVAFPSAVVASSLNCYIVRSPEIASGVPLCNDQLQPVELTSADGKTEVAISHEAAKRGVHTTTISRAVLQAPVYFVPPLLLGMNPLKSFVAKNPALLVPTTTYLLLTSFGIGLPATCAIFPQWATISANEVESQFQHLQSPATKRPYEVYYYNKGL